MFKGWMVALLQIMLVVAIAAQAWRDSETLPRAWVRTVSLPSAGHHHEGRYVSLWIEAPAQMEGQGSYVQLTAVDGTLRGRLTTRPTGGFLSRTHPGVFSMPLEFLLPEHAPDPTIRAAGEELWAEVLVPERGALRPVRLAVKKDGRMEPLPLR